MTARPSVFRPLFLAALMALPSAAAWTSHGQHEPDTRWDRAGDLMWTDAPTGGPRLYFHAFSTTLDSGVNPNLAALDTRLRPPAHTRHEAILGEWVDCNGDGAIGLMELAQESYPRDLLLDDELCPQGSPHRDGLVVRELLPVGRGPGAWLDDPHARVWGDAGIPGAPGIETCGAYPLPRGATSNSGRLIRVLDCAAEHRLIGIVNTVDNDGRLRMRISDPHHPERSNSILVRDLPASPFGNPINGRHGLLDEDAPPALSILDCDTGQTAPTIAGDPTNASVWSAADAEASALTGTCGGPGVLSPFHPAVEQPFEPGSHTGRERNDVVLTFASEANPSFSFEPWQQTSAHTALTLPGPHAAPRWRALSAMIAGPQTLTRGDVQPQGATYWTFYASVGAATTALLAVPGSSARIYGAEACGDQHEGVRRGWVCDPGEWWLDPAGDAMRADAAGVPWGARVHELYVLRDVDCLDGGVVPAGGIYASLALLSDEVCEPAAP